MLATVRMYVTKSISILKCNGKMGKGKCVKYCLKVRVTERLRDFQWLSEPLKAAPSYCYKAAQNIVHGLVLYLTLVEVRLLGTSVLVQQPGCVSIGHYITGGH